MLAAIWPFPADAEVRTALFLLRRVVCASAGKHLVAMWTAPAPNEGL